MLSSGFQTCALRSEEHTSELQSHDNLVCRLLLEKNKDAESPSTPSGCLRRGRGVVCRAAAATCAVACASSAPTPRPPRASTPASAFFFNDTATTEIYTLSLHDALPI